MAEPGSGEYGGMSEAQRNAIVEALLAQQYQQRGAASAFMGDAVAGDPYAQMADPSDPDTGYATAADIAGPVVASPGDLTGPSPAGLAAISTNAQSSNLNSDALGGNLASPSPGLAAAMAAPVGTPAGYYGGLLSPDNAVTAAPATPATPAQPDAFDQGLTFGGRNIAGHNIAPAFNAFEGAPQAPTPNSIVAGRWGAMQAPDVNVDTGYGNPAAFEAADQAMSALNDAVAAQMADALAGYSVTGTPTGAPAAQASPGYTGSPTGNVATDVGVGIGLGISGGFGGATGDGTSGSTAAGDAAGTGVGIGGAATGISGGPGGTGEGGANTGEGGVGSGPGGGGGGGGGDGGK